MDAASPAPFFSSDLHDVVLNWILENSRGQVHRNCEDLRSLLNLVNSPACDNYSEQANLRCYIQALLNTKDLALRTVEGLMNPCCQSLMFNDCVTGLRQDIFDFMNARDPKISILSQQVLSRLSLPQHQTDQLCLKKPLGDGLRTCAFVTISPLNLTYITGGEMHFEATSACIEFDHRSLTWRRIAHMQEPRSLHALVYFNHYLYVFGGQNYDFLKSAERLSLSERNQTWECISDQMSSPRHSVNPCLFQKKVYLALGGNPNIDVFCIPRQTFESISLKVADFGTCASVIDEGKLVLLTTFHLFTVNPSTGEVLRTEKHSPVGKLHFNTPSLLNGEFIYTVSLGDTFIFSKYTGERLDTSHYPQLGNNRSSFIVPNSRASR